jgi:two-component system, sensor histidine kinase PdtaS
MIPEEHAAISNRLLSVRYEHGIRKADILKWVLGISGISVLIFMLILFWNRTLKREIHNRKQAEEVLQKRTHDLGERVKELNCLYYISSLREKPEITLEDIIQDVVNVIPSSWQYPEITCSRIILEDKEYKTTNFRETEWKQANDIIVHGEKTGTLEVYYLEEKPEIDEGPFVKEERDLINAVTERLGRIIERMQVEEQIESSLKEKEVLLSEIHHRVKNNMQVIISLLRLQSAKITDEKYVDILKNAVSRIRSMALIHETLYKSKDFANIHFTDYIKDLTNQLVRSYAFNPNKIRLKIDAEDISLALDHAIPCGLIINELISNSLKYAFPKDREGEIKIVIQTINSDEIELTVSDDGIGISEDIDIENTESLGLQLVHILAEDQLDGTIDLDRDGGTAFKIRFKN